MTKEQIVEKIQRLRKEKGYTMNSFAIKAGISYANYYRIENKKTDMNVQTLQKICDALEISVKDFFDEAVENIPDKQQWYLVGWVSQSSTIFAGIALRTELENFLNKIKDEKGYLFAISEITEDIKEILEK